MMDITKEFNVRAFIRIFSLPLLNGRRKTENGKIVGEASHEKKSHPEHRGKGISDCGFVL